MDNAIINKLKKEIENFSHTPVVETSGVVTRAADGIAEIEGLGKAVMSEMVRFEVGSKKDLKDSLGADADIFGVILNLEEDSVKAIILGEYPRGLFVSY
jgi:F0F1-type ATP synthase alpha subunit